MELILSRLNDQLITHNFYRENILQDSGKKFKLINNYITGKDVHTIYIISLYQNDVQGI